MTDRVNPMPGQVLRKFPPPSDTEPGFQEDGTYVAVPQEEVAELDEADVITSAVDGTYGLRHKPVLDIDVPAKLVPSSTPGHYHLYLDVEMNWSRYVTLLHALSAVGIIEPGYVGVSTDRGYTAVRLPWVKKPGVDD